MELYLMIPLALYGAYHLGGRLSSRLARRRRPATRRGPKPGYNHRLNPATCLLYTSPGKSGNSTQ